MGSNVATREQVELSLINLKRCGVCKLIKHADQYTYAPTNWMKLKYMCRSCNTSQRATWRAENRERYNAIARLQRQRNLAKARLRDKDYAAKNPEKMREKWKRRGKRVLATVHGNLSNRIRVSLHSALKGKRYGYRSFNLVGYSVEELRSHLEKQFLKGMGWHNMGEWHIDHVIPLCSFEFTSADDPEVRRAWALPNLRPIWARENLRKNSRIEFLC